MMGKPAGNLDLNQTSSNQTPGRDRSGVPLPATWLGGLGITPFLGLSLATPFASDGSKAPLSFALIAYGAIILSFLGGILWGLAIGAVAQAGATLWRRVTLSVLPSLVAWVALLAPSRTGLWILAAAFVTMLLHDIAASRLHEAPTWYPKLRWPLTCGAVAALILAALS